MKRWINSPPPPIRTLRQLVRHLIATPGEMLGKTGLKIVEPDDQELRKAAVTKLVEAHQDVVQSVTHQIQTHWNNKTLHQTDEMYGEVWTRDQTLTALLLHLIHHRGQMTILMRFAGLKVPGIYGPAREEWVQFGMEPHAE